MAHGKVRLNTAVNELGPAIDAETITRTVDGTPTALHLYRSQVRWPLIVTVNKVIAVSWGGGGQELFAAASRARVRIENYSEVESLFLGLGWDDVAGDLNLTGIRVNVAPSGDTDWGPARGNVYEQEGSCWDGIWYLQIGEGSVIAGDGSILFKAYQWNYL